MKDSNELFEAVEKNSKYGYWELSKKYRKMMQNFYRDEYYQDNHALYKNTEYDDVDIQQKNNFYAQKLYVLDKMGGYSKRPSIILDIGAGEGYALAFFKKNKWEVTGIDLSTYGLMQHNPEMEQFLIQGDFEEEVGKIKEKGKKYDFINADNVLEHVPNPEMFFRLVSGICHKDTVLCVTVPNDYSMIQCLAYDMGMINEPFWVAKKTSEHFSYFSVETLSSLGEGTGFKKIAALADWPIDFFLLHPNSNYNRDNRVGHDCHIACAKLENAIWNNSMDSAVKLFSALAEAGLGRKISVYFKLK